MNDPKTVLIQRQMPNNQKRHGFQISWPRNALISVDSGNQSKGIRRINLT